MNNLSRSTPVFILTLLALMISACKPRLATVPEQTFAVDIPLADLSDTMNVTLDMAVPQGTLALAGDGEGLIQGAITYNAAEYEPRLTNGDGSLLISQSEPRPKSVLISVQNNLINRWDLHLGKAPMDFEIRLQNGEYTTQFARSLPEHLTITINAGVGKLNLRFDPEIAAQIRIGEHTDLLEISTSGNWTQTGDKYETDDGSAALTITVNMRGGELNLDNK